ncbi:hypothetical protein [uncultured Halomonas sp.]|uniref:hypothetical protein n=1 Tax=uncultured Halomonas sp. TaxID=173971 RepID=UPI002636B473|nr:hypothetical protein [uncultured Halomonas sp.]
MGMTIVPHRRRQELAEMLLAKTRDTTGRATPSPAQVADEAAGRLVPFDMLLEAVEAGYLVRAEGRMIDMPLNQVLERCRLTLGRSTHLDREIAATRLKLSQLERQRAEMKEL